MNKGIFYALLAAILFGGSTVFSKILLEEIPSLMLAGIFYSGSSLGLFLLKYLKEVIFKTTYKSEKLTKNDIPWLISSTIFGGILAPIFLLYGISLIPASNASLLLNSEAVLTSLLAWLVFKEKFDFKVMVGILFIVLANIILSFQEFQSGGIPLGSILIILSCLSWSIDNNIMKKISNSDPFKISIIKTGIAGFVILSIALTVGQKLPEISKLSYALVIGFFACGLSLAFFIFALRYLGTAKAGAYFAAAPFCGAALSLIILKENPTLLFWISAILMLIGIIICFKNET